MQDAHSGACPHSVFHLYIILEYFNFFFFFYTETTDTSGEKACIFFPVSSPLPHFGPWQGEKDLFTCCCTCILGTAAQAGNEASTNSSLSRFELRELV